MLTKSALYVRAWRARNPEKAAANRRAWSARNREKCALYVRAWIARNPGKCGANKRAWKARNPGKDAAACRRYYVKHRAELKARSAIRRARKHCATPIWACKQAILSVYAEAARLTELRGIRHHVDHIIPLKHPLVCGLHVEFNLQPIPAVDNLKKRNKFNIL